MIGSILSFGANELIKAIDSWVDSGAAWLLNEVGHAMETTTEPDLGSSWFGARFSLMAELAGATVLPMLCCAVIQAIYRQSAATLFRIFFVNLPVAFLLTGVAVELVRIALAVTDMMSAKFLALSGVDTRQVLAPVATGLSGGISGVPGFALFVAGGAVAAGALVLWLELIVRSAAITAAALFLPMVLAALVWPSIGHWARRLADTLASLILSKLVISAVISLAVGALSSGFVGPTIQTRFGDVLVGIALLILATLSPFVLLRLIPAFEAGAVSHLEGQRKRMTGQMMGQTQQAAGQTADLAKKLGSAAATALPAVGEVAVMPEVAKSAMSQAAESGGGAAKSAASGASGNSEGDSEAGKNTGLKGWPTDEEVAKGDTNLSPMGMNWRDWQDKGGGKGQRAGSSDAPEPESKESEDD